MNKKDENKDWQSDDLRGLMILVALVGVFFVLNAVVWSMVIARHALR